MRLEIVLPEFEGWPQVVKVLEESTKQLSYPQLWWWWSMGIMMMGRRVIQKGIKNLLFHLTVQQMIDLKLLDKNWKCFFGWDKNAKCRHFLRSPLHWDLPKGWPSDNNTWCPSSRGTYIDDDGFDGNDYDDFDYNADFDNIDDADNDDDDGGRDEYDGRECVSTYWQ